MPGLTTASGPLCAHVKPALLYEWSRVPDITLLNGVLSRLSVDMCSSDRIAVSAQPPRSFADAIATSAAVSFISLWQNREFSGEEEDEE